MLFILLRVSTTTLMIVSSKATCMTTIRISILGTRVGVKWCQKRVALCHCVQESRAGTEKL